jgi:TonB-dependent SusC/RagA subfamily outer membrane receptor
MEMENVRMYRLRTDTTPFSFFRWIFINPSMHKPFEIHEIIAHERVHVRQYHSCDILLAEMLCVFCWINPLVWLLKREIQRNLEFLVDYQVVKEGVDSKSYQYHLLRLAYHPSPVSIVNQFNVSPLKERIMMLNAKQSPGIKLIAYTLLLPLVFLFVVANNAGAMVDKVSNRNEVKAFVEKVSSVVSPVESAVAVPDAAEKSVASVAVPDAAEKPVASVAVKKGGFKITGILVDAENNQPIPGANVIISGTNTGTVSDMDGKFALEVKNGDQLVFSYIGYEGITHSVESRQRNIGTLQMERKKENLPEVVVVGYGSVAPATPGQSLSVPIRFHLRRNETDTINTILVDRGTTLTKVEPVMFLNGEKIILNSFHRMDQSNIESLTVLKDGTAEKVFGISGANGVILITTKNPTSEERKKIDELEKKINE